MSPKVSKKKTVRQEAVEAHNILTEALNNVLTALGQAQPLPVVTFEYPSHGRGGMTTRFVRVTEMTGTHLRGMEIQDEFDEEPGRPKTFLVEKIRGGGNVRLLHLASN